MKKRGYYCIIDYIQTRSSIHILCYNTLDNEAMKPVKLCHHFESEHKYKGCMPHDGITVCPPRLLRVQSLF